MKKGQEKGAKVANGNSAKLFFWTALAAFVFGLIELGQPLDDVLRVARNQFHKSEASGDIVVVKIDRKSIESVGAYPWPRAVHANLIRQAHRAGAKSIYFDMVFSGRTTPADDAALKAAINEAGNVYIAATDTKNALNDDVDTLKLPLDDLQKVAQIGSINAYFNFQTAVWDLAYGDTIEGRDFPSYASTMAGVSGPVGEKFPIDYSIQYDTIPTISAVDVINGKLKPGQLQGKTLIIGSTLLQLGDQVYIPGKRRDAGVFVHVLGAETLKEGVPASLGWLPALIVALAACAVACWSKSERLRLAALAVSTLVVTFVPILLEANLIFVDVTPALFSLAIVGGVLLWQHFKARGLVNELTGLPNLVALRRDKRGTELPLIAARIHNYAEIVSTLNASGEKRLVEQIVSRLTIGRQNDGQIYQGDEGIFAWFAEPRTPIGNHLEALHALFRSPITIDDQPYDIAVSFGVEVGSGRSLANRLGSALVAADEAEAEAIKWKYHDPARQEEASWRLSLLSQLDSAIEKGEVWLAFQPKLDLKTRLVVGAEALARWTHPEKGPISPAEFVAAAEQHDRIGKLTDFVLDNAIAAAADLSRTAPGFSVAVNLSARMLNDRSLPDRISEVLRRHRVAPNQLTLELTETAALAGTGADIELLNRLRDLGVNISIDDYGTGMSTLDYLKKVPASELKIDQSFVRAMRDHRSDLIMVKSTIALAHSLGRKVVAEGVEDREILDQLALMKCDIAQGFIIGRPMGRDELRRRLEKEQSKQVGVAS